MLRVSETEPLQVRTSAPGENPVDESVAGAVKPPPLRKARVEPEGIVSEPDVRDAPFLRVFHQQTKHGWMQVNMQVAIDVIQREAGCVKALELSGDLATQLITKVSLREVAKACARRVIAEFLPVVHQAWDFLMRQR